LYTLNAIAIGDALLVTPIVVSFVANALGRADTQLRDLARTLGASGLRTNLAIMRETFWSIVLSISASFNRCVGELGVATLVGGSLLGNGTLFGGTRVLTTSITLWTNFGKFDFAMAYGIILMAIVIVIALTVSLIERLRNEDMGWSKLSFLSSLGGR
jgi:tungstate transport system permease protein